MIEQEPASPCVTPSAANAPSSSFFGCSTRSRPRKLPSDTYLTVLDNLPFFFIRKIRQRNEVPNPNYRRSGSYKLDRRRFLQTSYAKNVEFEIKVEPLGLGPPNRLSIWSLFQPGH